MAWRIALCTEIAARLDYAGTKEGLPSLIDRNSCREWITIANQPIGETETIWQGSSSSRGNRAGTPGDTSSLSLEIHLGGGGGVSRWLSAGRSCMIVVGSGGSCSCSCVTCLGHFRELPHNAQNVEVAARVPAVTNLTEKAQDMASSSDGNRFAMGWRSLDVTAEQTPNSTRNVVQTTSPSPTYLNR